jgi:hypothetical protein
LNAALLVLECAMKNEQIVSFGYYQRVQQKAIKQMNLSTSSQEDEYFLHLLLGRVSILLAKPEAAFAPSFCLSPWKRI